MKKSRILAIFAAASAVFLAGCFNDNDDPPPPPPVVVVPPPPGPVFGQASDFGAGFATAFRADRDSEPVDPVDGDIIPITKSEDPLDIENP